MAIKMTGGYTSPEDMTKDTNTSGQAKTVKVLYDKTKSRPEPWSDSVYVPNMPQPGYQVPYPPVEKARAHKAKIVETAPDEDEKNSTFGQKPKRGEGKGINFSLRLRPEVHAALKANIPNPSAAMVRLVTEFVKDQGWL